MVDFTFRCVEVRLEPWWDAAFFEERFVVVFVFFKVTSTPVVTKPSPDFTTSSIDTHYLFNRGISHPDEFINVLWNLNVSSSTISVCILKGLVDIITDALSKGTQVIIGSNLNMSHQIDYVVWGGAEVLLDPIVDM